MSSKQSQKGTRFEYQIRDKLTEKCGVSWSRVPMSGSGEMKGDLYCLTNHYHYCIECKSFKDSVIMENLLSAKSNNLYGWWDQCVREANAMRRKPALVFKKDRGKPLIAVKELIPDINRFSLYTCFNGERTNINIYLFEDWLGSISVEDLIVL